MIRHIVLISQGPNDIGFMEGLRDRLGCDAQIIDYRNDPLLRRKGAQTRPKDARFIINRYLRNVDLFIRLTDGDETRPCEVAREERMRFPESVHSMFVCGVCDRDVEAWLALDAPYLAKTLSFDPVVLPLDREARSAFIKNRIRRALPPDQTYTAFVANFVRQAPKDVIKQ